jgi:ABC-type transport system involved in cytochrome bd biosynthesis fused ATPase/permease subunit
MRAFVRNYEIYLFDEFLSNINSELKIKLLDFAFHRLQDKTIIVISHDEKTLQYGDEIYQFTPQKLKYVKK